MKNGNVIDTEVSQLHSPAKAFWNQREKIASSRDRLRELCKAVGRTVDLSPSQWAQLMASAVEFKPDIILELGRGYGNSTCAFTEAANLLKPKPCKVLSLCISGNWHKRTLINVQQIMENSWFAPLEALQTNILTFDFKSVLENYDRILVFWDAHGYDVAEYILGTIIPEIADKPHLVVVHDMIDIRYNTESTGNYELWKGYNEGNQQVRIGNIESPFEEAVSIVDFANRNKLTLHSADHSFHTELSDNQKSELNELLGEELFSLNSYWLWFSLNEATEPYSYPVLSEQLKQGMRHYPAWRTKTGVILKPFIIRTMSILKALAKWFNIRI